MYHTFVGIMKSSKPLKIYTYFVGDTIVHDKIENTQLNVMTTVKELPRKGDLMKGKDL